MNGCVKIKPFTTPSVNETTAVGFEYPQRSVQDTSGTHQCNLKDLIAKPTNEKAKSGALPISERFTGE